MRHLLFLIAIALLLTACGALPDRCTTNPNLADCRANDAIAEATIAAANANSAAIVRQAYMRATQDAVALHAQSTQGAINTRATQDVVSFNATRSAAEIDSFRSSLALTATLQSVQFTIITTKTALEGDAKIDAARVQAATAQAGQWLAFGLPAGLLAALVVYIVFYSRRVASSVAAGVETRASLIHYGYRGERVAYRLQRADGTIEFIPLDQILGDSSRYLASLSTVPDLAKLAATVEADKRLKVVHISQNTNTFPALSGSAADQALPLSAPTEIVSYPVPELTVPTFAECLKIWRPRMEQMMLGYSPTGPVYCGLEDLLSVGIVGRPKTGKSTVLRFIFVQCVLVGAQVVVWDLHRTIVGSLPGANALTRLPDIDASAEQLSAELDRRLEAEDYTAQPIMVLADEYPLLAPNSSAATSTLNRIILEGRKVNLFSMIAGQGLPADLFGGSTPRDALSSRYVLHTTTRAARMAGLEKDQAPWVVDLKQGQAVVDGPVDAQVIGIPNTTAADVESVLALADSHSGNSTLRQGLATRLSGVSGPAMATAMATPGNGPEIDSATVAAMRAEGLSTTAIIAQLWGAKTGRRYTAARAELAKLESGQ